jgi:hypothetical protein
MEDGYSNSKQLTLVDAKRIVGLKTGAFKDYLSARVLFNNDLLVQASFLANTAIEKELKLYIEILGTKTNILHDTFKLLQLLKDISPKYATKINSEYLKALTKIYQSRYSETLGAGYNFAILKNKFLSELDYTYSVLEPLVRFRLGSIPSFGQTSYEKAIEEKDNRLWLNNYLLNGLDRATFLNYYELIHEYRIVFNHEILEVLYKVDYSVNDSKFIYQALTPGEDNSSVYLSHLHDGKLNPNVKIS